MTRRCTCCGQAEHRRDLPAGCLVSDLTCWYQEGNHRGPGLHVQLRAALGDPRRRDPGGSGSRGKPGSRPPGWRDDISDLLAVMGAAGFGRRTAGWLEVNVARDDLTQWRLEARQALGLVVPSVLLDEVSCARRVLGPGGWYWAGCGQVSLRVAQDAQSDVWCGSAGCHDDQRHPGCRIWVDALGYDADLGYGEAVGSRIGCRRTERDLRHAMRWKREEWAGLWTAMQDAS